MSTTRKKQFFKAMKFLTIKNANFYSSQIKWVYSIIDLRMALCLAFYSLLHKLSHLVHHCFVLAYFHQW